MTALHKAFASYLDENRFWSYQETLIEVIAVLWISTSVSAEIVKRYFPGCAESRMDPESTGNTGLLWKILGFGHDPCFWDRAVSFWKVSNNPICLNNSTAYFILSDTKTDIAYVGAYATLAATVVLYFFLFFSLFINRSWRESTRIFSVVSFHEMRHFLPVLDYLPMECGILNPLQTARETSCTKECRDGSEHCKYKWNDLEDHPKECGIPNPPQTASETSCTKECQDGSERCKYNWSAFCFVVIGTCAVVLFISVWCIKVVLWLLICILPVVCVGVFVVTAANVVLGEEAVFPCFVLLSLLLTVYCIGRLAGMWMRSTYVASIWNIKGKWSNAGNLNKIAELPFETVPARPAHQIVGYKYSGYWLPTVLFSLYIYFQLEISLAPAARICLDTTNETNLPISTNGTGLGYWDARLSYWFRSSVNGTSLPEPSEWFQTVGQFCHTWSFLVAISGIVFHICIPIVIAVGVAVLDCLKCRYKSTPVKGYPKWYTYLYGTRPVSNTSWPVSGTCCCAETLYIFRNWCEFVQPFLALSLLSFPILECFVPEKYHLPVFLLMITAGAVAAGCVAVRWMTTYWYEYKWGLNDPLGNRFTGGTHPLCDSVKKQGCQSAEQSQLTEKEQMLSAV